MKSLHMGIQLPKTRFSGLVISIILLLVFFLGALSVINSYNNEDRLVERAFVNLKQNSSSIKGKINSIAEIVRNKQPIPENLLYNRRQKDYVLRIDSLAKPIIYSDTITFPNKVPDSSFISGSKFFSEILDNSFFDENIVFKESMLFYRSFNTEPELLGGTYLDNFKKSVYIPANFNFFKSVKDSAIFSGGWNTGFISKIDIGYKKYYLFIYPFKVKDKQWYVGGLLTNKNYQLKKGHVETWFIILVIILLTFILFSIPFIKLLTISKTERINTIDLVLISFSMSGIACLVTLLTLNYGARDTINQRTHRELKSLNDSIHQNFTRELKLMYHTLENYETRKLFNKPYTPYKQILTSKEKEWDSLVWKTKEVRDYPYFKSLFKSSSNGTYSQHNLTTWKNDSKSRISFRQYFQHKDEWQLPDTNLELRCRLESVFSNTSGDAVAILAKPGKYNADSVYGISSPVYSIINTVLAPGYEFRVIDNDGKVWFHNNIRKNLRDNFLDECDHDAEIIAAIHNRINTFVDLKISQKNYQSYISPIGKLPLYLVVLSDMEEQNEFLAHVDYIFVIYILLGFLWGFVAIMLFFYEKAGRHMQQMEDRDNEHGVIWLLPDTRKNYRYLIVTFINFILALFIIIPALYRQTTIVHLLLILFCAFSVCATYIYFILKPFKKKVFKRSLPFMFLLLLILCNIAYYNAVPNFFLLLKFEVIGIFIIGSIVGFVIYSVGKSPSNDQEYGIRKFFSYFFKKPLFNMLRNGKNKHYPYQCFIFSWIAMTCIIPPMILFWAAANEETELITKKSQIEFARQLEKRNLKIDSFYIKQQYPALYIPKYTELSTVLKQKGIYTMNFGCVNIEKEISSKDTGVTQNCKKNVPWYSPNSFNLLLNKYLRRTITINDYTSFQMLADTSSDPLWYWEGGYINRSGCETLILNYSASQKKLNNLNAPYVIQIKSELNKQKTALIQSNFVFKPIFLFELFFFLIIFSLFIKRLIKNMFMLSRPEELEFFNFDQKLTDYKNVFLVHLPPQQSVVDEARSCSYAVHTVDDLPKKITENTLVLLSELPTSIKNWKSWIVRLNEAFEASSHKIVILSNYTPEQLIDFIDEQLLQSTVLRDNIVISRMKQQFSQFFSEFKTYFYQQKETENKPGTLYYQFIWETCTIGEKFILFDIASDNLVNTKNRVDINNLIGKGILQIDGKLDIADDEFKQYIRDFSDTSDFLALEMVSKRKGGWNKIKGPIYFIFFIIVAYILFSQQDVISGVAGTIVSIIGLIAALFKFVPLMKKAEDENQG